MQCPVCNGTGVMALPHVPGNRGGWIDQTYNFSGMECGACNGTGVRPDREDRSGETGGRPDLPFSGAGYRDPPPPPPPQPPSAEQQLETGRNTLLATLRHADHLPGEATVGWRADLPLLDVYAPETGRALLADIRQEFEWAKERYRPARDIFSMSVTAEMGFDNEMREIDQRLAFLEALMDHARDWLRDHPEDRRG